MAIKVNIVNLTDHDIVLLNEESFIDRTIEPTIKARIKPSGTVARVTSRTHIVERFIYAGRSIPVTNTEYGDIVDLPNPVQNTIYVVSKVVAERVLDRNDIFIASGLLFSSGKKVIGCRSLARIL